MTDTIYMTIPEMMVYIRVSRKTAYMLVQSGKIPSYRLSPRKTLVKKTDVDKYIRQRKLI